MRFATVLCVALLSAPIAAQPSPSPPPSAAPPRVLHAARRTGVVSLDGRLDEPAWTAAEPSGAFVESFPAPGKAAPDRTEVRVLHDDQALYVGIRMFDAHPDSIAAGLARRDATAASATSDQAGAASTTPSSICAPLRARSRPARMAGAMCSRR